MLLLNYPVSHLSQISSMCFPYLLDVVVRKSATVLKLLASENQALLVRRNPLLILDLRLNVVDSIRGLDLKGDSLAGDCEAVSMMLLRRG